MRRYHSETEIIKREHRRHLRRNHGWPKKEVECICDLQAGRFRKQHGLGCRKVHCYLCHGDKYMQYPTKHDLVGRDRFRDSLADCDKIFGEC